MRRRVDCESILVHFHFLLGPTAIIGLIQSGRFGTFCRFIIILQILIVIIIVRMIVVIGIGIIITQQQRVRR